MELRSYEYYDRYFQDHLKDHINFDYIRSMSDDELLTFIEKCNLDTWGEGGSIEDELCSDDNIWVGAQPSEIYDLRNAAWRKEHPEYSASKSIWDIPKPSELNATNAYFNLDLLVAQIRGNDINRTSDETNEEGADT